MGCHNHFQACCFAFLTLRPGKQRVDKNSSCAKHPTFLTDDMNQIQLWSSVSLSTACQNNQQEKMKPFLAAVKQFKQVKAMQTTSKL